MPYVTNRSVDMETVHYWKIALEIVILWYVIYMVLLFVKGTRSEQLLKGLFIIGIIFIIAQQLGLETINWAMTRLFPISVVALIVIFQPELRKGLAQLGQFGIHQESAEVVDEVVRAASALARSRTGALIVIEREAGLKTYSETGTRIDAAVSSALLTSIFLPPSPLHDGAVVIERGRLSAAGCVLPLSQDDAPVPKSLGMRHRASIGITEETDAVCIVVSEETGALSIAQGGRLTHGLTEENLARTLGAALAGPPKQDVPFDLFSHLKTRMPIGKR